MYLQYTIYLILVFMVALTLALLAAYIWRRRAAAPAATPFAWMLGLVGLWGLMEGLVMIVPSGVLALAFHKLAFVGVAFTSVAWLVFALQYTELVERPSLRFLALLSVIPLLTQVIVWTNEMHTLFKINLQFYMVGPFRIADREVLKYGPWFWVHAGYTYLLLAIGLILVAWKAIRWLRLYRGQAIALLISVLLVTLANAIHTFNVIPGVDVDISFFGFAVSGTVIAWALFRYQLFDVVPVARRIVIEGMGDGMLVLDTQNRIVDLNPALGKIIGLPPDPIGKPIPSQVWGQLGGVDSRREIQATGRWYDTRAVTLTDRQNKPAGQLIVLHDITERKQAEDEMRQAKEAAEEADRMKSVLVSMVSHDLRTPLNVILGYSEMLQECVYGPLTADQGTTMARITANAQRLLSLINDLLDQAQIEAGKLSLKVVSFEPAKLVDSMMSVMGLLAQMKGLALTAHIEEDVPGDLQGDPQRLHQILVNLVGNALKFTEAGNVHVRIYLPDEIHWAMAVSDTGQGIPPDKMSQLFERFYQVETDITTRKHQGVGLGLAIVKQLVGLMGGQVSVESEVGKGSTFTATLPLVPHAIETPA